MGPRHVGRVTREAAQRDSYREGVPVGAIDASAWVLEVGSGRSRRSRRSRRNSVANVPAIQ